MLMENKWKQTCFISEFSFLIFSFSPKGLKNYEYMYFITSNKMTVWAPGAFASDSD